MGGSTSLTTEDSGTIAATTKYLITDPIDIAQHMHSAMDSACDYWLARIRGTGEDKAFSMYQRDLRSGNGTGPARTALWTVPERSGMTVAGEVL